MSDGVTKRDLIEMSSVPLITGLGLYAFDRYVGNLNHNQALNDAMLISGTNFTTDVISTVLGSRLLDTFGSGMTQKVGEYAMKPLINAGLYYYAYDKVYKQQNEQLSGSIRIDRDTLLIGAAAGGLLSIKDPVVSALTGISFV